MATAAELPDIPSTTPARMQVRACNFCRQRKVKCDRQSPQCSNCLRSEIICTYPPGQGRAPKRIRRSVGPQLTERLSRLENIVNQFGAAAREDHRSHKENPGSKEAYDAHSFDQSFSRLKVDESKSYYVNNALWVLLSNEVDELRDLLFEPASEDADYEPAPSPYSSHLGINAAMFGYRAIASSLHDFHPALPQAVILFTAFTDNVVPLVRIFHMPTLTRIYWDAIASLDSLDRHTEALLFAIHYSAVISFSPEECLCKLSETRETALRRYRFAVEQALARGDLLNTQNMTMLQAAVLFVSAMPNEDDSRAAWSLTSLLYHIARTMGLHRDGTLFGVNPFEAEIRRRLWWQIGIADNRSSEYHCNEPIGLGFASDTKPPLHINDADLSPDMAEPPAERWDHATDMTLTLIRCEAMQTAWKLGLIKQKHPKGPGRSDVPTTDGDQEPHTKRHALIQDFEARLRDKYLPICCLSVPFQLLCSTVARTILARFCLTTQYSIASREKEAYEKNKTSPFSNKPISTDHLENMRGKLFRNSVDILDMSSVLLTDRGVKQWAWYSKTRIQWGAMAFVLSEICVRPPSPECDRAWNCVTTVYNEWKLGGIREDKNRLALWRPIKRLMAKARYVRELQSLDTWKLPQADQRSQWCEPDPYPSTGFLSHYPLTVNTPSHQAMGSIPTPEPSLPGGSSPGVSSVPYKKQSDPLQRVFGTETLDPFMDMVPDWSWADDGTTASPALGIDLEPQTWLT